MKAKNPHNDMAGLFGFLKRQKNVLLSVREGHTGYSIHFTPVKGLDGAQVKADEHTGTTPERLLRGATMLLKRGNYTAALLDLEECASMLITTHKEEHEKFWRRCMTKIAETKTYIDFNRSKDKMPPLFTDEEKRGDFKNPAEVAFEQQQNLSAEEKIDKVANTPIPENSSGENFDDWKQ